MHITVVVGSLTPGEIVRGAMSVSWRRPNSGVVRQAALARDHDAAGNPGQGPLGQRLVGPQLGEHGARRDEVARADGQRMLRKTTRQ